MTKVALCVAGNLRGSRMGMASVYNNLFLPLRNKNCLVDVFLSTWDKVDTSDSPKVKNEHQAQNIRWCSEEAWFEIEKWSSLFPNLHVQVNEYEETRNKFFYSNFSDRQIDVNQIPTKGYVINNVLIAASQLYNILEANKISKLPHINYDIVVRLRPDFIIGHDISDLVLSANLNKITFPILYYEKNKIYAVDDRFAISNPMNMDIYSNSYLFISDLIKNYNPEEFPYETDETKTQYLSCERILWRHLKGKVEVEAKPFIYVR